LTGEGLLTAQPRLVLCQSQPPEQDLVTNLSSPVEVRKMLLANGFDQKILDQTSDVELMNMVKEVLNSTSTNITP
jgi:hypothetical protein